ncbi:MAG: hypothetical protein J7L50_01060, partial [Candidatus Odinarchaeota archaeon]|nr:hypothetical protein [Candidatus Odinarchaeota archaeon]
TEDFKAPHFYWMNEISKAFFSWIGEFSDTPLDYLFTVAPIDRVMVTFERAVSGGAMPGRIPGYSAEDDVVFIDRSILHKALIYANPHYDRIMNTLVAYQYGWWIYNNFGEKISVDDTTLTSSTKHKVVYHIGEYEVYKALNEGVALWYYADHGGQGYTYWNYKPFGPGILGICYNDTDWRAYEDGGSADNPDTNNDGIVNPREMIVDDIWGNELDENLENVHSAICVFMACLVGSSQIPIILMKHGALAVTADIRTLYFGYGYAPALFVKELYSGKTLGQALVIAINETSYNYYTGYVSKKISFFDDVLGFLSYIRCPAFGGISVQYVLYGDPKLILIDPVESDEPQAISPSDISLESGHSLGIFEREVNVSLVYPRIGSVVKGTIDVSWEIYVENTAVNKVTLLIDGEEVDVTDKTSFSLNTLEMNDGNHTISIIVEDVLGNVNSGSIWVIVDNTFPSIRITSPDNHAEVSGVVEVSWVVMGDVKYVLLIIDGLYYNVTGLSSFRWNSTTVNDGVHNITVLVMDLAGEYDTDTIFIVTKNVKQVIDEIGIEKYNTGILTGGVIGSMAGIIVGLFSLSSLKRRK